MLCYIRRNGSRKNVMGLPDDEFRQAPIVLRTLLINLVQRGLHQRWVNRNYRADLILRRINHRSFDGVKRDFLNLLFIKKANQKNIAIRDLQLLHFLSQIEITIIGPGYDEIEMWLRKVVSVSSQVEIQIKDVIDTDPQLKWFWPEVKEAVMDDQTPLI